MGRPPSPKTDDNVQTDDNISLLLDELRQQREANKKLQSQVDILMKSVDHNMIRKNTPKENRNPRFRVNFFDGKPVLRWDDMVKNKVVPTPYGTKVEQVIRFYYADDKEGTEINYEDFHTYRTQQEFEATTVSKEGDETFYSFLYEGETYIINIKFIN
jgi:hypothetical protein